MNRYLFTFGTATSLADAYVIIEASSEMIARKVFLGAREFAEVGRAGWSSVYPMPEGPIEAAYPWLKRRVDVTEECVVFGP